MSKFRYWISPYIMTDLIFITHCCFASHKSLQMEITADNINVSSDDPAVSQRTPLDDFPCLGWRQITPGSLSGVPTENGGSPCGRLWFFFCQLHHKFPRVTERRPAGDRAASHGTLADELICETSADHPANFNCELNLPDDCRTSARWVLCRLITTGFLQDFMQKSPRSDPTMDLALLGRRLKQRSKRFKSQVSGYIQIHFVIEQDKQQSLCVKISWHENVAQHFHIMIYDWNQISCHLNTLGSWLKKTIFNNVFSYS